MRPIERSNVLKCTAGEGVFGIGMGLVAAMTALPLLLTQLGAGKVLLGLGFSICTAGWYVGQPVGLVLFGRRRRTKRFLVPWSFCCSVPTYLAMGLAVYFLGPREPRLCAAAVLGLLAVRFVGGGSATPLWFDWQALVFRREIRGRAIGMMAGASALGVSIAALAAGAALRFLDFPVDYGLLFAFSAFICAVALGFFLAVREPASVTAPATTMKLAETAGRLLRSLREKNFRRYLVARIVLTLGAGATGFYAIHFKSPEGGGLADSTVIALGAFLTLPQALASYVLGRLGDRAGHKVGILLGALAQVASLAVAFLGRGGLACIASFALVGVAWSSAWVSHVNMLFETCPHDSRVAHITLGNMFLSPFLLLVPLGTGWFMEHLVGVRAGIGWALVPTLLGVLWLVFMVREPRTLEVTGPDTGEGASG